ncbi:MAG: hypothetical protein AAB478_01885 [Patescibacteria group bacterium]
MAFPHHHEKRKIMINLFTLPMIIGILALATVFSAPVRRIVNIPQKIILGAKDNRLQEVTKENFSKEIVDDTKDQLDTMKTDVLKTTVGEILEFLSKGSKITKDLNGVQQQAGGLFDTYTNLDFIK